MTNPNDIIEVRTLVVGAGVSGLALGSQLRRRGEEDFLIIERANEVGGVWRDNVYPGVACDIPSQLYSLSFRLNPSWSRVYSPGGEIHGYLKAVAREEGLLPYIRFQTRLERAEWSEEESRWLVTTSKGVYRVQFVLAAMGHLTEAKLPDIPGIETFTGEFFHSARWDNSKSLEGKRIGVVGTGASAIQLIPELAKTAEQLVVFQRTAPWVEAKRDRPYTEAEKRLFERDPATLERHRSDLFWLTENGFAARRGVPRALEALKASALAHLEANIEDPELRAKLTPDYEPGCKRILFSNNYYPAMARENVHLEASALASIEGSTAVAASGETYELDAIVFATGFESFRAPMAEVFFGRSGESLSERWDQGMEAYAATSVHGFPNLFIINGPNSGLGHSSMIYIFETQARYIMGALEFAEANGISVLDVKADAEQAYSDKVAESAEGTVWLAGGCDSWYLDGRTGRLTLLWPDFAHAFRAANGTFNPEPYTLSALAPSAA